MKLTFILLLFIAQAAFAKEYTHNELQHYVGYTNLSEHPNISRSQIEFINLYFDKHGPWARDINDYLASDYSYYFWPHKDGLEKRINEMDELIQQSPLLPHDLVLFRGLQMNWLGRHYRIGEEFQELSYVKASSHSGVARFNAGFSEMSFVMVYYYADEKGRAVVLNTQEKDVLMARGLKYKVMDSFATRGQRYGLIQVCTRQTCMDTINNYSIASWWRYFRQSF
jgi:hypothetical protein